MTQPVALLVFPDERFSERLTLLLAEIQVLEVTARNDGAAAHLVQEIAPDVMLLDLDRPGRQVARLLEALRTVETNTPTIWFATSPDAQAILRVQQSGAHGFLDKRADPALMARAIRTVLAGDTFFPGMNTFPATPGAKGVAESERLLKVLHKLPPEVPGDPC